VLQRYTLDRVAVDLSLLLARRLYVPHGRRADCIEALVERVRDAMLDQQKATLRLSDVHALAKAHGGLPTGPEPFVEPTSFPLLRRRLDTEHVVVLLGEPGVGKTIAAERLVYEHRVRAEPFAIVEPENPRELAQQRAATEPTLVYVEDPFGKFQLEE